MAITNSVVATGDAPSPIYTSTGASAVTTMYLCNKTGAAVTANVFVIPNGSTQPYGNLMIYSNLVIQSNDTYIIDTERLIFSAGDAIYANSSVGSALVSTISYASI
jgi:hypothetical protein